jgi:hypothetical protein
MALVLPISFFGVGGPCRVPAIPKTELIAKYLMLRRDISPLPFRNLRDCRSSETLALAHRLYWCADTRKLRRLELENDFILRSFTQLEGATPTIEAHKQTEGVSLLRW